MVRFIIRCVGGGIVSLWVFLRDIAFREVYSHVISPCRTAQRSKTQQTREAASKEKGKSELVVGPLGESFCMMYTHSYGGIFKSAKGILLSNKEYH